MLTQKELRSVLRYDAETGLLFWLPRTEGIMPDFRNRESWNAKHAGKEALTHVNNWGYKIGSVFGRLILAHRAVWILNCGDWRGGQIDYINGDKIDNRLENLRVVDCATNQRNKPMTFKNTSGVVGVAFHKGTGRWAAKIGAPGRSVWLGTFHQFEDAVRARMAAEIEHNYHPNHGRI